MPHTTTADHVLGRMTEVQKIKIHQASPGILEYIRQTTKGYGEITADVMKEIKDLVTTKYTTYDASLAIVPSTWKW